MEKIYDAFSKQWDSLYNTYKKNNTDLAIEELVVLELGLNILYSNLNQLKYNDNSINKMIELYKNMFKFRSIDESFHVFDEMVNPASHDILGRIYEEHIHSKGTRKSTGQFYSPKEVVDFMVKGLGMDSDSDLIKKKFIDIACGTGIFILSAVNETINILEGGNTPDDKILEAVVNSFYGLDINRTACIITKINLFNLIAVRLKPEVILRSSSLTFKVYNTNSIENRRNCSEENEPDVIVKIKNRLPPFDSGFDYIIGNPPYLEAKKMPRDLKEICKSNYSEVIFGAFDLYIAFIAQCNRLVGANGKISLILPNKFTVAKYAIKTRGYIINNYKMLELIDLSQMDIFHKADVYPVVICYQNSLLDDNHKVITRMSIQKYDDLISSEKATLVTQRFYKEIGTMTTFFCLPNKGDFEKKLASLFKENNPIGAYIQFASTVSFHQKGLREQYVRDDFNITPSPNNFVRKYLGGISYTKKSEVSKYNINWYKYYINYDQASLKETGNPLPPLSNFEQEKIILCQHATEITAAYDHKGEWVTKDVFPIAFAKQELAKTRMTLKYFTGLLNSKLFSFIYGIIYKGIQISAGYYHYLPTWLEILPVIEPDQNIIKKVEYLVDKASASNDQAVISKASQDIDNLIFDIYGINPIEQEVIHSFFNKR
ncbi:MAG: Eco57I restriction-modification methylase domain-containing protein [Bacillota bacterium]